MDANCPLPPTSQAFVLKSRQVIKNEVLVKSPLCMLSLSKLKSLTFVSQAHREEHKPQAVSFLGICFTPQTLKAD